MDVPGTVDLAHAAGGEALDDLVLAVENRPTVAIRHRRRAPLSLERRVFYPP
jgi:hypothetical protein